MIKNCPTLKNLVPLFFLLCSFSAFSQTYNTTVPGPGFVTVPPGVTQVTVEVWGAGGGGGRSTINKYSAGGGGGGAYTIAVIDGLTSGDIINYTYGSAGIRAGSDGTNINLNGGDGGTSTVFSSVFPSVTANGGKGGRGYNGTLTYNGAGGSGGLAGTYPGGAGHSGYTSTSGVYGGGGGSSAGIDNSGTPATFYPYGAIAPLGGGDGGSGTSNPNPPFPSTGSIPGGGGGGSIDTDGKAWGYLGGDGAAGQIRITWSTLDFIGTVNNDYVDFGNNHSLTSSFSLEAWVLQKATVTKGTIISIGDALSTSKRGYHLVLNSGKPNLTLYDNTGAEKINITSSQTITSGINAKWHHIAATYNGASAIIYVDGVVVSPPPTATAATISGTGKFLMGAMHDLATPTIPKNNFDGYIDEVRVWNVALTVAQIREMMNQEIKDDGSGNVKGVIVPLNIAGLAWTNLSGYYPMNDNTTNDKSGNLVKKHGSPKNMTTFQPQTAPLPYKSVAPGGTWSTPATWLNGDVQNPPNSTGINWNIVETSHNMTSGAKDITVLGLISKAGKLTMANPLPSLQNETNPGQSLRVTHYLELDGDIDLVGESQLLQDTGSILDQDSGGYIERDQQGTANSYNYNYWSSSVGPISAAATKTTRGTGVASTNAGNYLGVNGRIEGLMDGSSSGSPVSINFQPAYWSADSGPSSPRTISTYWLYTFYGADDNYWAWKSVQATTPILAGEGYTMKGTSGTVAIATMQNYIFKGKPYNGDITLALDKTSGEVDRLIGNPYPSAIDANEFIKDHIKTTETINGTSGSNTVNENVFNGALYFWDHFGAINSHNLGAYVGGYATYTLMGGTKAIADDKRINTTSGLVSSKVPERYIPVGQGFFVITALDAKLAGKTTTTVDGGTITFKNSQRYFKREGSTPGIENIGSVFMKNTDSKKENEGTNGEEEDFRPKIRLLFHSPNGYNRQLLIGADENTTNNFDIGYDGLIADTGSEDMFWMIQDAKFVIQGVPNFNTDQEFPLGIKIVKSGLANIKIDTLENMDDNISVHIKDKLTGESHNISRKPFEIDLTPGTYLDRFALTFKMQKLVTEDVLAELLIPAAAQPIIEGIHVFMNNAIGELQIKNNSTEEITSVALINALGQTIKSWNSNFNIRTISLPLSTATGIYFVQINTKTGKTIKKISVE